jgi:hypothetical protein
MKVRPHVLAKIPQTLHISPEQIASEIVRPDAIDVTFSGTPSTKRPCIVRSLLAHIS